LSEGEKYLYQQLLSTEYRNTCLELLSELRTQVRQPLKNESLDTSRQVGPYLHEQIDSLPIMKSTRNDLSFNWSRFQLSKDGSKAYMYIKKDTYPPRIQFRSDLTTENKGLTFEKKDRNITAYRKALETMPEFVNTGTYLEIDSNNLQFAIQKYISIHPVGGVSQSSSFRETYGGAPLQKYLYSKCKALATHVKNQQDFIHLSLATHRINHGHPHERNMNVRFLLTDPEGSQTIEFDANQAFRHAKIRNATVTPVVTLRDWDAGDSR
jgi:hypothetical protein